MRQISIRDFGPLSHVDLQLDKPLQVIIGPQASGKSAIAKSIYFCRKIRDYLVEYVRQLVNTHSYDSYNEYYINFYKYLRKPFMGCFGTTKHMRQF